jgi:undecaprenyl pyrophosphate phosphatase UppP
MLRSFALTYSFIVSVILTFPVQLVFRAEFHAQFTGNTVEMNQLSSGVSVWIAWIVSLIAVEWWLDRELIQRSRRAEPERPQSTTESPFAGQPSQAARS